VPKNAFRLIRALCIFSLILSTWSLFVSTAVALTNGDFSQGKIGWQGDHFNVVPDNTFGAKLRVISGFALQDKIAVDGHSRYSVTLSMRSIGQPSAFVQMMYSSDNAAPQWQGLQTIQQPWGSEAALAVDRSTSGAWQKVKVVIQPPSGATYLSLYLRRRENQGTAAEFANVAVEVTRDPLTSVASITAANLRMTLPVETVPATERDAILLQDIKSGGFFPARLTLAENRITSYHVHVSDSEDVISLGAAKELADYLAKVTDADFRILSTDVNPQRGPLIVVGRQNRLAHPLCPSMSFELLHDDGFNICTSGKNIVIAGATPRGTMYGVNWFLDHIVGVKWLAPNATYIPNRESLVIDPLSERQVPRFRYREILNEEGEDPFYRAHNLLNGESHGPSYFASPPTVDDWDRSWLAKDGDVSLWDLLPRDRYGSAHPNWYYGGQLAMMNPDVRRTMAAQLITRLRALPDYRNVWFGIHIMDWGWDMDPSSVRFASSHGGKASAPLLDLISDLAARVRVVLPGARFAFNAYHWGFTPPDGMTVPDYLLVYPMTIHLDYSTPLFSGRNIGLSKDILRWNDLAKHIYIWDHITNFAGLIQPTPNIYPIAATIQWLAKLPNVSGYLAEGSWMTPGAEFASLRTWVISRLLWQPSQDPRTLVHEYCRDYFGVAGQFVFAYIDLMHKALASSGDVLSEKTPVDMAMFTPGFVSHADMILDAAEKAVSGNAVLLARVREARMPLDFVILVRRSDYENAQGTAPRWNLDYKQRLQRFKETVNATHLTTYRQDGDLVQLFELLAINRVPNKSGVQHSASGSDIYAIQDLSLNMYSTAHIVGDSSSSDGAAISMRGDSPVWAVQLKFDKLPRDGQWDLYVDAKVTGGSAGDIRIGSYPPMNRFEDYNAAALEGSRFQRLQVPGGPFGYSFDHSKGVYVQATGMSSNQFILIDRFIAVRRK
jgi:hypothetical protein